MNTYSEYLKSDHWQRVRARFYVSHFVKRDKNGNAKCGACGESQRSLELHHKTYENLGREKLSDLILLCNNCHELVHSISKSSKISILEATQEVIYLGGKSVILKDSPDNKKYQGEGRSVFTKKKKPVRGFSMFYNPKNKKDWVPQKFVKIKPKRTLY